MKRTFMIIALCLSFGTLFAQSAVNLKNAGNAAMEAKDYKKALENYEKAMASWGSEPKNFAMISNAGSCAYKLKEYPKAIKYFDQVIEGSPDTESAFIYKALAYKSLNKPDECIKAYTDGLAKNPQSAQLKDGLFKYYRAESKNHYILGTKIYKVVADKVTAKKLKTTDPAYLTEAEKAKKEFTTAITLIDKSLVLNPNDDEAKKVKAASEQNLNAIQ
jgi:tetratricopeptide (TPR) repeat protein